MAKWASDAMLDTPLSYLAGATRMVVCSAQPANFAGIAAVALADVALDSGDFTLANGDTSGRKVTVGAQAAIPIDASGTGNHIAYDDGTLLRFVTTCPAQVLTSGGTVTVAAHDVEIADPV